MGGRWLCREPAYRNVAVSLNRYAKRRDANEPEIIKALESIGCVVERLDTPCDLLVSCRSRPAYNWLIEVKVPGGTLTKKQKDFIRDWPGQIRVLETAEEAIELVTEAYREPA
jgi:hypothetical protein